MNLFREVFLLFSIGSLQKHKSGQEMSAEVN